jgi:hypothetical protein
MRIVPKAPSFVHAQGLAVRNTVEADLQELMIKRIESGVLRRFFQAVRIRRGTKKPLRGKRIFVDEG